MFYDRVKKKNRRPAGFFVGTAAYKTPIGADAPKSYSRNSRLIEPRRQIRRLACAAAITSIAISGPDYTQRLSGMHLL